jgi:hypothetical protein
MYVEKGRKITEEEIFDFLRKIRPELSEWTLRDYAYQFIKVNDNLLEDAGVYGVTIKVPDKLDKGFSYYSIVYVDGLRIKRVWMPEIADLVGAYINKRKHNMPYFCFRSSVIGMDRLLEATDKFFSFLRSMDGCYAQVDCL